MIPTWRAGKLPVAGGAPSVADPTASVAARRP